MLKSKILLALTVCVVVLSVWLSIAGDVDRIVALNTVLLGAAVNLMAIPLGIAVAMSCMGKSWFSNLTITICLSLIFVPLFVYVSAWDAAFGKLGWITGISTGANQTVGPWLMAIWIHGLAAIPQVSIVLWLGMTMSGRVHEERASLDANQNSIFWHITLPKIMPLIGLAIVWNFVVCAREIAVTDIYRIGTLAEQIYLGYSLSDFDAMSGAMTTVIIIATVAAIVFFTLLPTTANDSLTMDLMKNSKSRTPPFFASFITTLVLLVLVAAPAINLIARASRSVDFVKGDPIVSYSLANMFSVVARVPSTFVEEFCWSTTIAATSTIILTLVSVLLVWRSTQSRRWKIMLLGSMAVCCSLPGPLIGSGLLEARSWIDLQSFQWLFDRTVFAPVVANTLFCFPISVVLVWFIFQNIARDADESMATEGASPITRLFQLVVLANGKMLLGSMIIVFAVCFGELSATQLAVPPGIDTIPRRMLGLLHSGVNDHTAGLTIVSVCTVWLLILAGFWLFNWNQKSYNE